MGFVTLGGPALDMATHSGGTLVLLCAQIENLSSLHQEFGPGAREQAVREAAGLLTSCFRLSDFLARLGPAQFAALAVDAAEPSASVLRQRVESRLSVFNQAREPWGTLVLRLCAGSWGPNDGRSFLEFLGAVEANLGKAPAVSLDQRLSPDAVTRMSRS